MSLGMTRSNSYQLACADTTEPVVPAPVAFSGTTLKFGDRKISQAVLAEFDIKCGHGRLGNPVGHGAFGCVRDFYFDRAEGQRVPTPECVEWVFKPEHPHEQTSFESKIRSARQYQLTDKGWLHGTLRSLSSYRVALAMGIDNIVETHIGFAGDTPGALMRKVHGETMEAWLVREGFYERMALSMGYTKEQLSGFIHSRQADDKERFKDILRNAFETAIAKKRVGGRLAAAEMC